MTEPEEVLKSIKYIPCPACNDIRSHTVCTRCEDWGYVVDPPLLNERIRLGLRALNADVVIEVSDIPIPLSHRL